MLYNDRALFSLNNPTRVWCIAIDFASSQYCVHHHPMPKALDAIQNKPEVVNAFFNSQNHTLIIVTDDLWCHQSWYQ